MGLKSLIRELIDGAKQLGLPPADLYHATEFNDHGEYGLSFDHIITQLHEYDIKINREFYDLAEKVAAKMKLPPEEYNFLQELIIE